jgi:hypothetical protein
MNADEYISRNLTGYSDANGLILILPPEFREMFSATLGLVNYSKLYIADKQVVWTFNSCKEYRIFDCIGTEIDPFTLTRNTRKLDIWIVNLGKPEVVGCIVGNHFFRSAQHATSITQNQYKFASASAN